MLDLLHIDPAVAADDAVRVGDRGRRTAPVRADDLARPEAMDGGKPLAQAQADAMARYRKCRGGATDTVPGETIPCREGDPVCTLRDPHGVTGPVVLRYRPMQISAGQRARYRPPVGGQGRRTRAIRRPPPPSRGSEG